MSKLSVTVVLRRSLLVTGVVAYFTKPSNESFVVQSNIGEDVVTKFLLTEFIDYYGKFDDFIFFKVATVPRASAAIYGDKNHEVDKYYGAFNNWYKCRE